MHGLFYKPWKAQLFSKAFFDKYIRILKCVIQEDGRELGQSTIADCSKKKFIVVDAILNPFFILVHTKRFLD